MTRRNRQGAARWSAITIVAAGLAVSRPSLAQSTAETPAEPPASPRAAVPSTSEGLLVSGVTFLTAGVGGVVAAVAVNAVAFESAANDPRWVNYRPDLNSGAAVCSAAERDPSPAALYVRGTCASAAFNNTTMWVGGTFALAVALTGAAFLIARAVTGATPARHPTSARVIVVPTLAPSVMGATIAVTF